MRKHRSVKWIIHLVIIGFALGVIATQQIYVSATTKQVTTGDEFLKALEDTTVDVIQLTGDIQVGVEGGGDEPLIINRAVTIQGGTLTLRKAGIILGANVTFQDMNIGFSNTVRNAIIANGHTLMLKNVGQDTSTSANSIHLFCGGITVYTGSVPAVGSKGEIILDGSCKLGNIYAGSLSDGADESSALPNDFSSSAVITVNKDFTGTIGNIYAHGARESRGDGTGDILYPDATKYKATGGVTINLKNGKISNVYGATGGSTNASVIYTDDGKGYLYTPYLGNLGSLILDPGTGTKANIQPKTGSSIGASVSVPANTYLDLTNMGTEVSVTEFHGGGTLILGEAQKLIISGAVSGKTSVAIKGITYDGASSGDIKIGHSYLQAVSAAEGSFGLLPSWNQPDAAFTKDAQGNWSVPSSGETAGIVIDTISMTAATKEEGITEVKIPVEVTYASSGDADYLSFVPISAMVNSADATRVEDNNTGYSYTTGYTSKDIEFYFTLSQDGDSGETLYIKGTDKSAADGGGTNPIAAGEYKFNFTIPKENMKSGSSHSFTITLTVEKAADPSLPEDKITVAANGISHTYNGNAFMLSTNKGTHFTWQGSGAASIQGYYLDEGNTQTTPENSGAASQGAAPVNGGTYYGKVAVASDGTYGKTTAFIPFTIHKADLEVQSLPVVSPITPGQALSEAKIYNGIVVIKGTNTSVSGTWMWVDGTVKPTANGEYEARFLPTASTNFNELTKQKLSVTVSENLKAYTVNYKAGEGKGTMTNGTAIEGTPFTLPSNGFTAPMGKEFSGWLIEGKEYKAGDKYTFTKNTEVTAVWKAVSSDHKHTGGTATCTSPATCISCGLTYGTKNSSNHTGEKEIRNKKEATATTDGYTGDTWCLGCKTKIATGTVIKATGTTGSGSNTSGSTGTATGNNSSGTTGTTTGSNSSGNSGSGSSGSTGTGTNSSQSQTPTTISTYGTKNTVKPKASLSGSTVTVMAMNQNEVQQVLAEHSSKNPITFDVSGMGKGVNTVNLSRENLKAFADSSNNGGLRITLTAGTVNLDAKALKAIVEQSDGDTIRLVLNNAGTSLLNDKQKKSTQNMQLHGATEIYFLSVKDNKRVSDLKGGMMTVSLPFSIPSGYSSGNFFAWYMDENGTRTKLTSWYEGYKIHWQVGHNSVFILSYGSAGTTNTTVKSPKTGDLGLDTLFQDFTALVCVALVVPVFAIVSIAVLYGKRRRGRGRE